MGKLFVSLDQKQIDFIKEQKIFFVGTAAPDGLVNISPKGMDSLRVLDNNRVIWLNLTGSGNETAAHLLESSRMTVMFCSFEKTPMIMRLYGQAKTIHPRDVEWGELIKQFPEHAGARQIFDLKIEQLQTSCGFAVPFYEYSGERETLDNWSVKKGPEGIEEYWQEKNRTSLDGKTTGITE